MSDATPRRTRREIQADQTRAEILASARRLFAAHGYARTSVKDVATDAGVSLQTVYDSVGSKADLVRHLNDGIDGEARLGEIVMDVGTVTDPTALVRIPARVTARLIERCGDILRALIGGAMSEPELAQVTIEGQRRHRAGAQMVANRIMQLEGFAVGITAEEAATTMGALADYRLALALLDEYGMSLEAALAWMGDTTAKVLLADRDPPRSAP
jgi:AcrR family transcriptional regulator